MDPYLSSFDEIPEFSEKYTLEQIQIKEIYPTQTCIGISQILSQKKRFTQESTNKVMEYLKKKPVPIVRNSHGEIWILNHHHRLRAILELDNNAKAYGYVVDELTTSNLPELLHLLNERGWLYLYDNRGRGPITPEKIPKNLLCMQDDPYRSLTWKLKEEGRILKQPFIPYHEFRWAAWLRTRALPPFDSFNLYPALPAARQLTSSKSASKLPGWKGLENQISVSS